MKNTDSQTKSNKGFEKEKEKKKKKIPNHLHKEMYQSLSNKIKLNHPLFCYSHTQIQYLLEFSTKYHKECSFIAGSKLCYFQIGKNFVSEYTDLKQMIHLDSQFKNTNQKDNTHNANAIYDPKLLIVPCVYSNLKLRQKNKYFKDFLNREHYKTPQPKQLTFFLRSAIHNYPTSESHINDLYRIIFGSQKKIITILVDYNDLELNPNSFFAIVYFGRLWRELNLDMLNIVCYTPNQNYFNSITNIMQLIQKEHRKEMDRENNTEKKNNKKEIKMGTGNEFANGDQNEDGDVCTINGINREIQNFSNFLSNLNLNNLAIHSVPLKCKQKTFPWNDYEQVQSFYQQFNNKKLQKIDENFINMKSEYQFFQKHITKQPYLLTFQKCKSTNCKYCLNHPNKSKKAFGLLNKIPKLFTPMPSDKFSGHYQTFLEKINNVK